MVNTTPTGTIIPTVEVLSAGIVIKSMSISTMGAIASLRFLDTNTTPSPPKSAGSIISNAGLRTGESRMGERGAMQSIPIIIMIVVTMLETAMDMVEMTSPSSLLAFTFALSMASIAQGSLRLEILPVTKERYVPPAPSMGT